MGEQREYKGPHTLAHAALATAVRLLIQLKAIHWEREFTPVERQVYERMEHEVKRWAGTEDVYAQGIMAPMYALCSIPGAHQREEQEMTDCKSLDELLHAARYVRRELWELSLFHLENLTDDQRTRDQIEAVEKAWIVLDEAIRNTEMAAHQPRLAKPSEAEENKDG